MSKKYNRYTVTAALPYANGPLHIGHIAGAYLPADIYVRFQKLLGKDVVFVCGSDEHGAAITLRAKKEGINPQDIVDKYHEINKQAFQDFGIQFDIYDRTSNPMHKETAQEFFKQIHDKGAFFQETREQLYDPKANEFLADRYVTGECPNCGNANADGDQCEKCGSSLNATDLKNPKSSLSGETPVLKDTSHWYLPLGDHEEWLREWIEKGTYEGSQHHNPAEWKNQVIGQCKSWIDGGLGPRAITRDLDWGVKVPLQGADGKVLYVWFDAPIGYISATKTWAEANGKDWEAYWKSDDTKLVHFIGKDNIVFHCIIFPVILKLMGGYVLPDNVPANEFLNLEGDKLSTRRNWAVWLHEYLEEFPGKQDELRYVLASIAPESKDSEFTWKDYQARVNNELVGILGNFVNRALVLTNKNFEGTVPKRGELYDLDKQVIAEIDAIQARIEKNVEVYRFREALAEAMNLARAGNKYLAETEPWKLVKTDPERVGTILNLALQITANLTIALEAFLPHSAEKIRGFVNIEKLEWSKLGSIELLPEGHALSKPSLLFSKIEDQVIEAQIEKLKSNTQNTKVEAEENQEVTIEPAKDICTFDDFMKMDIRVGTILEAEKLKKSNKLLKLLVDTGLDQRTILSGIAKHYSPEEVIGKQVTVLTNLAPRKMMGIESEGMILMGEDSTGKLAFVTPENVISNGGVVR